MGIRGMESYLEKNNASACFLVNIARSIQRAREDGHSTTIVVDGMSCLRYIYGDLPWIPGGQVKEYVENVEDFVQRFTSLGAELVFFFDGPPAEVKLDQWKRRRLETIDKVENALDKLNSGVPISALEGGDWMMIPGNIGTLTGPMLKRCGCQKMTEFVSKTQGRRRSSVICVPNLNVQFTVIRSIGECDEEIARYAHQNRCLAIFGQDTDFVIYPGALHYWSVKHFNKHNMTTLEYSGRDLASSLHLRFEQLPLLATLLGNDIVQRDDLRAFHCNLKNSHAPNRYVNFSQSIHNVARFVRRYPYGDELKAHLPQLAHLVFNDQAKWELLRDSIESYNIMQQQRDDLECKSGDDEWDAILRTVRDSHINGAASQLYGAIVRGIYNCSNCLEDYRLHDLPFNQVILNKLRRRIYGILLFEKPKVNNEVHVVRELAVSGRKSLDYYVSNPVISPRVPHPGLIALWNKNDTTLGDVRWTLLCDAVDIDHYQVRDKNIPVRLMIFLLSMKYLMDEGMKLEIFELNALISSAILVEGCRVETLKRLPTDPVGTRAIRLYTLVTRAFGSLMLLNIACGFPIPEELAHAYNYQDGKLYHQVYRMAKSGCKVEELCEHKVANIDIFDAILEILPVDKATVSVDL